MGTHRLLAVDTALVRLEGEELLSCEADAAGLQRGGVLEPGHDGFLLLCGELCGARAQGQTCSALEDALCVQCSPETMPKHPLRDR